MKILYTATVASHISQFHLAYLKMLQEQGNEIHVAAHNNLAQKNGLQLKYMDHFHEIPFQRSPLKPDNIKAYFKLKELIDTERFDLIVCNTPTGGIVTRLAARAARKHGTKVIYIAHGFHFCKGAPLKNWLLYYPVEKFMARYCDILVTITKEDYALASRKFHTDVRHIHGIGVSPDRYHPVSEAEQVEMRYKENLSSSDFVILCVGELNKNKNQSVLIRATALLKEKIPNIKVLLAGNGPMEQELKSLVQKLGVTEQIRFLGYRTDLETITPAVDLVVSCSKREGLPLNILEAMLCAKPVIASDNRGHRELVQHEHNGYLTTNNNSANELVARIEESHVQAAQRTAMGELGYQQVFTYLIDQVKKEYMAIVNQLVEK